MKLKATWIKVHIDSGRQTCTQGKKKTDKSLKKQSCISQTGFFLSCRPRLAFFRVFVPFFEVKAVCCCDSLHFSVSARKSVFVGFFCANEKSLWSINNGHGWENWQETASGLHTGSIYTPGRGFHPHVCPLVRCLWGRSCQSPAKWAVSSFRRVYL